MGDDDQGVRKLKGQTAIIISEFEMATGSKSRVMITALEGSSDVCNKAALGILDLWQVALSEGGVKTWGDVTDGKPNDKES